MMENNQLSESVNIVGTFCLLFIIAIEILMLVVLLWLDKQNFIPAVIIFALGFIILILVNKKPQLFDRLDKIFKKWGFLSLKKSSIIFIIPFAISFEILSSAIANNSLALLILTIFMIVYYFYISRIFSSTIISILYGIIIITIFLMIIPTLIIAFLALTILLMRLMWACKFNLTKIIIYITFLIYLKMMVQLIFEFHQFNILPLFHNYYAINNSSLLKVLVPMIYGTYIWLINFILANEKLSIFVNEIISRFSAIVLLFIAFLSNDMLIEIFAEKTQLPDKQVIKIISMAIQYFTIPSLLALIVFKIIDFLQENSCDNKQINLLSFKGYQ